jgi:hypothetical protein
MAHPKIISLNVAGKYSIQLAFSDGTQGVVDLSALAGKGVFKAWDVDGNFQKAFINLESGAVSWPGSLDIDTLNCYLQIKGLSYEEFKAKSQHTTNAIS